MPGSQEEIAVFRDHPQYIRKFPRIEAVTVVQQYFRFKPYFRVATAALDMNVRPLGRLPLVREEVVALAAVAEHDRHDASPSGLR